MATATKWNVFANEGDVPAAWREKLRAALQEATFLFALGQLQPWSFRFEGGQVELFLGNESMDEVSDPDGRETIIRCGGVLQAFKLALKRQGCHCRVNLFPVMDQPRLIARILVAEAGKSFEPEQMVFDGMMPVPRQGQNAGDPLIPGATLDLIQNAVASVRCWLEIAQCQRSREQLVELASGKKKDGLFLTSSSSESINAAGSVDGNDFPWGLGCVHRRRSPRFGTSRRGWKRQGRLR